ncbi:hypothetical protein OIV83_005205 [Microbotryomycetes sp. JL201]|nr:hypothetical protein OIV83_005205 [Microbotryomycetes sp. JL201]
MGLLSALWPLYRRSPPTDYETVLSNLEKQIKAAEAHLLQIRLRERRANALFVTYGIGAWLVYALVWYALLRHRHTESLGASTALFAALVIGPILSVSHPRAILFTRRIVRSFYKRQQNKEETILRRLKKEQREKVEELKRKTGYYSTKNLIDKYDEDEAKKAKQPQQQQQQQQRRQKQEQQSLKGEPAQAQQIPLTAPVGPGSRLGQLPPLLPPAPPVPPPRTLMDKVADALIGVNADDEPYNKYALICSKCYAHNGLVPRDQYDTIQYQCPRCGFMNPSRRSLLEGHSREPSQTTLTAVDVKDKVPKTAAIGAADNEHKRPSSEGGPVSEEEDAEQVEQMLSASSSPQRRKTAGLRQRSARDPDEMDMD